jgi:hypothetical protein
MAMIKIQIFSTHRVFFNGLKSCFCDRIFWRLVRLVIAERKSFMSQFWEFSVIVVDFNFDGVL